MVSNAIDMTLKELVDTLARIKRDYRDEPEYKRWRANFPKRWPM